jgi:hypothetical protein
LSATPGSTSSASDGRIGARLTDFARRHFWLPLQRTIREAYEKQYYPLGYSPALDGLRGIMTVGIIVAHTRYPLVPGTLLYYATSKDTNGHVFRDERLFHYAPIVRQLRPSNRNSSISVTGQIK